MQITLFFIHFVFYVLIVINTKLLISTFFVSKIFLLHFCISIYSAMKFIVNDNSINFYGFRVATDGIEIPSYIPLFFNHDTDDMPLGTWKVEKIDGKLVGEPFFDETDDKAVALKKKVESGVINACSAGLYQKRWDGDVLVESKIKEISICTFPANENAIRLYGEGGDVIELSQKFGQTKTSNMDKVKEVLNLSNASDDVVTNRVKELVDVERKYVQLSAQIQREKVETLVSEAIGAGKISEAMKSSWVKLAQTDFDATKNALDALSAKQEIKLSQIPQTGNNGDAKKFSEWSKENPNYLINLKQTDFAAFNALYRSEYGKDYKA